MAKQPSMDRLQKELVRTIDKRKEMDQRIRELEDKILELKRSEIIGWKKRTSPRRIWRL